MPIFLAHESGNGRRLGMVQRGPELGDEGVSQKLSSPGMPWELVKKLDEPLQQHVLVIVVAGLFGGMEETDCAQVIEPQGL